MNSDLEATLFKIFFGTNPNYVNLTYLSFK